jgi:hypothetical protein
MVAYIISLYIYWLPIIKLNFLNKEENKVIWMREFGIILCLVLTTFQNVLRSVCGKILHSFN